MRLGAQHRLARWERTVIVSLLLVAIIAVLTLAFVASAVSGVAKGIQWLSNANAIAAALLALPLTAVAAHAQSLNLDLGTGGTTERALQLVALITVLALAPSVLVMATSFTRIVVVLSILRSALGTQTAPPNAIIVSLALFLTAFVMAPTAKEAYRAGVEPLIAGQITQSVAFDRASAPFKTFMLKNVREKDLKLFLDMAKAPVPQGPESIGLEIVTPAFMISELRRTFEIGFLLYLPFIVIDLVVTTILMAMGMSMVSPTVISIPFKLFLFIAIDGWSRLMHGLVLSYAIPS